jgi:hypothetical protein
MRPFPDDFKPSDFKGAIGDIFRFLPKFIMNPAESLNELPNWDWPVIFALQVFIGVVAGSLAGMVILEPLHVIGNGLLFPVQYILCALLGHGVLHLAVQPYLQIQMTRKESYLLSTLLLLPLMIFRILSLTAIPVEIMGFILGLWLFYQTMIHRYRAPDDRVRKVTAVLALTISGTWFLSKAMR